MAHVGGVMVRYKDSQIIELSRARAEKDVTEGIEDSYLIFQMITPAGLVGVVEAVATVAVVDIFACIGVVFCQIPDDCVARIIYRGEGRALIGAAPDVFVPDIVTKHLACFSHLVEYRRDRHLQFLVAVYIQSADVRGAGNAERFQGSFAGVGGSGQLFKFRTI